MVGDVGRVPLPRGAGVSVVDVAVGPVRAVVATHGSSVRACGVNAVAPQVGRGVDQSVHGRTARVLRGGGLCLTLKVGNSLREGFFRGVSGVAGPRAFGGKKKKRRKVGGEEVMVY